MWRRRLIVGAAILALATTVLGSACKGRIGSAPSDKTPNTETPRGPEVPAGRFPTRPRGRAPSMGDPIARRLTAEQFRNSLVDVFQDDAVPVTNVLTDPPVFGFQVDAKAGVVRDLDAQQLMTLAERVGQWAAAEKQAQISPCTVNDSACRRQFVETFGRRIFRGQMTPQQVDRYLALVAGAAAFDEVIELTVTAMVQSPTFLYRREVGETGGGARRLTPVELATNLAYLITNSTPDDVLLEAAAQGRLSSQDDLLREMDRLLATPAAREVLGDFVAGWLEIDDLVDRVKNDEVQANFTDEVRRSMLAETKRLFVELFYGDGRFQDLLTADYTYIDGRLSQFYQLGAVGGDVVVRTEIPDGLRPPGVLGHGSFLARHALAGQSSPVLRGYTIRKRLMCETVNPPPPGIDTMIGARPNATTTREKYSEHSSNPVCASCHVLMDPIGFTFENFDEFGRRREDEGGYPIDSSGGLVPNPQMPADERVSVPEEGLTFDGYADLIAFLQGAPDVEACFARFWTYYALGVAGVAVDDVIETATARGGTLKNYLEAIVLSDHFARRRAP